MKKLVAIVLVLLAISCLVVCFRAGLFKNEKLSEGKDNEKLYGAWILLNETSGFGRNPRYLKFEDDNLLVWCDYVSIIKTDSVNDQFFEEAPHPFEIYTIDKKIDVSRWNEKYVFSFSEGFGLEYQKQDGTIVKFTEKEGWHLKFLNNNKFCLTSDTPSVYYGYRLKEPLY